jgi:hypothetical protein
LLHYGFVLPENASNKVYLRTVHLAFLLTSPTLNTFWFPRISDIRARACRR